MELLVAAILTVCPLPDGVYTTACMENINNCAWQDGRNIPVERIVSCVKQETGKSINANDLEY